MTKWISVKDKLPEEDKDILFYCGFIIKGCYVSKSYGSTIRWGKAAWLRENGVTDEGEVIYETYQNITHWMPLPDPPVESKDD